MPTLAAWVGATLVGLLYLSPVLRDLARTGAHWPIWLDPESVSLTTYGKWWVLPPHHYLSDGASGDFPVYVYYVSDSLLNAIAQLLGWAPMTVQAILYGPVLGSAFLLLNYVSLAAVLGDRRVALAASLLLSLGGNSLLRDWADPVAGLPINTVLHVPFRVISLATAQSLGWVLFLPSLCLAWLAYRKGGRRRAAGAALALLFQVHTLTFVNAAAAQLAFLVLANLVERPRDRRFYRYVGALGLALAAFLLLATRPAFPFPALVALGGLVLLATFLMDPRRGYYAWFYGTALAGVLPWLAVIGPSLKALLALQEAWSDVQRMAVGLVGFLLFFAAYLGAALLAACYTRQREPLVFATGLLLATALLAVNHLWHWGNHPYRFAIQMLFPLALLAALGLRDGPRWLAHPLSLWLGVVCLADVAGFVRGDRLVSFHVADPERAGFLSAVRQATAPAAGSGLRILTPPEFDYPRGVLQATMLMNYSRIPAFVPDYRHVLWRERYHNRLALFCFLFPDYPNLDHPFGRRGCDEPLTPEPGLATIRDPRLKSEILPVYRVGFAGATGKPFANHLKDASPHYGWPFVASHDGAALVRIEVPPLAGVARLEPDEADAATLAIRVLPERAGPHVVLLGGRRLQERAPRITLDDAPLAGGRRSLNWALFEVLLGAGAHRLELPSLATGPDPQAEYLYFAAVIEREAAPRYLALEDGTAAAPGATQSSSGP